MTSYIIDNLIKIKKSIKASCEKYDINHSVSLLAVSKKKPISDIKLAYQQGQIDFGENYLNEALEKQKKIADLGITWHFIGHIQSNKTKKIAENFSWAHTVDSLKVAQRLSNQRPNSMSPINICLQINIDHELTKSGLSPNILELNLLCENIIALPNLKLRGLMCIPSPKESKKETIRSFERMKILQIQINQHLASISTSSKFLLDTLSMGMSDDMDEAIACDASIVRVGSAIFGQRTR